MSKSKDLLQSLAWTKNTGYISQCYYNIVDVDFSYVRCYYLMSYASYMVIIILLLDILVQIQNVLDIMGLDNVGRPPRPCSQKVTLSLQCEG